MSQENVEIVRQAFAAFTRDGVAALAEYWDPEIEVEIPPDLAQSGTYRGRVAVLRWMAEWDEAWEKIDYTPEEFLRAGAAVLVTLLYEGIGKGSGARVEGRFWYLIKLRNGKICVIHLYGDQLEALRAAGLRA